MVKKSSAKVSKKNYGWHPDLPDHRDHVFSFAPIRKENLPAKIDLRGICPPVYDQGQLGSCTGNAIAGAYAFAKAKETGSTVFMAPSRLFIYYNERSMEHTITQDSGAQIRDGIKTVVKSGVCTEKTWPYNIAKFKKKPTAAAFKEGLLNQAVSYARVPQTLDAMKACLASGFPVVFGFTVYEAFESAEVAKSGVLNLPAPNEQMLGGHAVLCVGFDDSTQRFIVRNSWGDSWGQQGYFTMPYAYLLNSSLSDDLWTIRTVE